MTKEEYWDILHDIMLPYARRNMGRGWRFQHDNDPKHTAKLVQQWIKDHHVSVLQWPAQSPDLNFIENLWQEVKLRLGHHKSRNAEQLWLAVEQAWYSIPQATCQRLVDSMNRRCAAVLRSKGQATKY
jgi:hypothetical protein